jgi:manganese transport protein
VLLAAGILGATIMPHVIYLHSALSQSEARSRMKSPGLLFRASRWDVAIAMTLATFVNMSMLAMAAAVFHGAHTNDVGTLEDAYRTLEPMLGGTAVHIFGASLIVAGISSTVVGTLAGQEVMQDFLNVRIPLWVRRAVTMIPSLIAIAAGVDVTKALVFSQVVLSFGIVFALVPLLLLTSKRSVMGTLTNHALTTLAGWVCVGIILLLNVVVIFATFF